MAISEELNEFVREALSRGVSRGDITVALHQAGWGAEQVKAALCHEGEVGRWQSSQRLEKPAWTWLGLVVPR